MAGSNHKSKKWQQNRKRGSSHMFTAEIMLPAACGGKKKDGTPKKSDLQTLQKAGIIFEEFKESINDLGGYVKIFKDIKDED
jgi:hypothetical protein